jgi:hypothetical protein
MAEDNKNNPSTSIFGGVTDAINKNKRRTPRVENPGVLQPNAGIIQSPNNIENVQQQFLDWQVKLQVTCIQELFILIQIE